MFNVISTNIAYKLKDFFLDDHGISKYKETSEKFFTDEKFFTYDQYAVYEIGHINDYPEYLL